MSNDWFFEKFALIADAPGAVDRMRELVLELAVRGQLIAQEYRDTWATEQLAELQPSDLELSPRFDTPANWIWAPLDALLSKMKNGYSGNPNKSGGHYKVTRIETIARGTIDTNRVGFADDLPIEVVEKHLIVKGDILFSHINSEPHLGKTAICTSNDRTLIHGVNLLLMRTIPLIDPQYLNTVFKELRASGYFVSIAQRAINQSSINQKNLGKTLIPLPPLAEQKRIVAKVDELMGLCDELEGQQQERELRKSVLVRSSLSRFAESPTMENLGYLFHNSYDIPPSELRKSILTLAVQGKLVPQDPEDEPAAFVLERSDAAPKRAMRTRASDHGDGDEPTELEPLFELPPGWEWVPFGRLPLQASVGIDRGRSMQGPEKAVGYFKMNNIRNSGGVDLSDLTRIDATTDEIKTYLLVDGDFLFNTRNSRELVGKTCVYRAPPNDTILYNNNILRVRFIEGFSPDFIDYWFRSPEGREELENLKSNTTNVCAIYQGKLTGFPCVVPPLAEQHRIVAKVDQLMALVDKLERQQVASREKATKLLDAIVHEMTSGG